MSHVLLRPLFARALAVVVTVLLVLLGAALPAFAQGTEPEPESTIATTAPVETEVPDEAGSGDHEADSAEYAAEEIADDSSTEGLAARAEPDATEPTLIVSKVAGLDAAGETVTVSGSGYNPAQAMYLIICRDIDLADVDFAFASGCTSGAKMITPTPSSPTMVKLEADGTFTTTFTVARNASFPASAIYTVANHTAMDDRGQDAKQTVSFTPLLTVTPSTGLARAGQTVTVTGVGYNPAQPMYLIFCRDVPVADVDFAFASACTSGAKMITPTPSSPTMVKLEADGTFTTTFTIAADPAHTSGSAIYTVANHTAMGDRSQDARRVVAFAAAVSTSTTVTAPATAVAEDDVTVTVTVTPAVAGTVVLTGAGEDQHGPVDPVTGTASFTLTGLAPGSYALSATFTPTDAVTSTGSSGTADLTVVAPAAAPTLTVSKTSGLDASGETVTVTGSGYNPAQAMYLIICRDVPLSDVDFGFATAGCTSGAKQITPNPTTPTMVKLEADGTFTTTFTVAKNPAHASGTAIYTLANHTAMDDRTQDAKQTITFTPLLTVTPSSELNPAGQTVTVTGSGYDPAQAMYLIYCRDVPVSTLTFAFALNCTTGSKQISPNPTTPTMVKLESDGTFTTTLTVAANASFTSGGAVYTVANHTAMNNRAQDARRAVTFAGATPTTTTITAPASSAAGSTITVEVAVSPAAPGSVVLSGAGDPQSAPLDGAGKASFTLSGLGAGSYDLTVVFTPASPLVHAGSTGVAAVTVDAPASIRVGALSWGIKADFRAYVTGPIAQGSISTSGATSSAGSFRFTQIAGSLDGSGLGSVSYGGTVRFTGHAGALDVRFSDPIVRIDSASSGTLLVRVNGGSHVAFASLDLAAGSRSVEAGAVSYRSVPATLTSSGATAFSGFYASGESLDAVSFVVGSSGSVSGGTRTVSSFTATGNTAADTPPATEGVESEQTEFTEGGSATFTAEGFQPNESGILAVIYSEPTVLADDLVADAAGVVTWTGALPRGLTGQHTFTFQGSVDRGIVIDIVAAPAIGCAVDTAELDWGFKESFRAYIDGSIANGEWTMADGATYATPLFSWTDGSGGYDAATGDADLAFTGSITFTGHGGVLNTTVANPRIVIDGDRAVLVLDVSGTTQDGETIDSAGVEFVTLDLAAAEVGGGGDLVALSGIPATLTDAGAAAFGTYEAGTAFDPIDLRITVDPACVTAASTEAEPTGIAAGPVAEASPLPWILGGVALLAVIAIVVFVLIRRSRTA